MVSRNPNGDGFYLDPGGRTLPGLGPFSSGAAAAAAAAAAVATTGPSSASAVPATVSSSLLEDPSKKLRKPYTITKSRESWTEPEHDKFLEALQLFDRDWKKIEAYVGSKTVIQIRSHAQKYFLKVQKSGTVEHLPPPRPKRKAAYPYPQKAPKNAQSQVSGSFKSTSVLFEPGYAFMPDSSSTPMNSVLNASGSPWTNNAQTISFSPMPKGAVTNKCPSSSESTPRTRCTENATDQGNHGHQLRVLPDFAQVYSFIGSVFDPCATDHLRKLKKMDPIDVETVLLLMRNLSINLNSPDFEDHRRLLSSYDIDTETNIHGQAASLPSSKDQSKITA